MWTLRKKIFCFLVVVIILLNIIVAIIGHSIWPENKHYQDCLKLSCSPCNSNSSLNEIIYKLKNEDIQPLCCSDVLYYLLSEVSEQFEKNQIEHFVTYGTLLGAERDNNIIKWTADIDIAYLSHNSTHTKKKIRTILKEKGIMLRQGSGCVSRVCFLKNHALLSKFNSESWLFSLNLVSYINAYPYGDLYQLFNEGKSSRFCPSALGCVFQNSQLFPVTNTQIRNKLFPAPLNSNFVIKALYGDNWTIPSESLHGTSSNCQK